MSRLLLGLFILRWLFQAACAQVKAYFLTGDGGIMRQLAFGTATSAASRTA